MLNQSFCQLKKVADEEDKHEFNEEVKQMNAQ